MNLWYICKKKETNHFVSFFVTIIIGIKNQIISHIKNGGRTDNHIYAWAPFGLSLPTD